MHNTPEYRAAMRVRGNAGFGDLFRYHGWLSPRIRLFRARSFQAKSAAISLAFLAPLLFTLFYLWSAADGLTGVTRSEPQGISYFTLVLKGVKLAQLRRLAATTNPAALADAQAQERANFDAFSAMQQYGKPFNLDAAFRRVSELQAQLQQSPVAATFEAHSAYIDALLDLNNAIAGRSQLALDPDLDSYHMMNIAILRTPLQGEMVARIGNKGLMALQSGQLAPTQHDSLMEDLAIEQQLVKEIAASYQQGLATGSMAAASLDLKVLTAALKAQRAALKEQVLGQALGQDAAAYLALSNRAFDGALAAQTRIIGGSMQQVQAGATVTAGQAIGIAQVQRAMETLDASTQQNAALIAETAAASGILSDRAHRLNEETSFFKLS